MKVRAYIRSRMLRALALFTALSLALLLLPLPSLEGVDVAAAVPVQPFLVLAAGGRESFARFARRVSGGDAAAVAELRERVRALEARLGRQEELLRAAQDRLAGLLREEPEGVATVALAEVIGTDAGEWRRTILVNRGADAGVERNQIAVWNGAIVGRVVGVGPRCSRVMLLTDPASRIAARARESRTWGVVAGVGERRCSLRYVGYREDVAEGEALVSAGADGLFPPHYLVGRCVRGDDDSGELMRRLEVAPWVRADQLERVELVAWTPPDTLVLDVPGEGGRR